MAKFTDFRLPAPIENAIRDLNFEEPTEIQFQSIPFALKGRDLIACAQTGSGKTAAYTIPMLAKLLADDNARALILAPTRELVKQISDVIHQLTTYSRQISHAVIIGGADMNKQLRALKKGPRIIIATPGRLMDHLRRQSISIKSTQYLVLDEGDRMLDMGFQPQLDAILKYLPQQRQTLLFSATLAPKVRALAARYLQNPESVTIGEDSTPVEAIKQTAIATTNDKKDDLVMDQLNQRKGSVIIFTRTQLRTDRLAATLTEYGFSVARIHGGRTQGQRNSAIQGFREGAFRVLVATDIAARGLDVPHIQHVINYDLPMMEEDYVHRIGRTARAGATGEAVSLVLPQDRNQWIRLARRYKIKGVSLEFSAESRGAGNGGQDRRDYSRGGKKRFGGGKGRHASAQGGGNGGPSAGGGGHPARRKKTFGKKKPSFGRSRHA